MPVNPGFAFPILSLASQLSGTPVASHGLLDVTAKSVTRDLIRKITVYDGNVVAKIGVTKVTAEHLELDEIQLTARAVGKAILTDPEGTISAAEIFVCWLPGQQGAKALGISANLTGLQLKASSAVIKDSVYQFDNVFVSGSNARHPIYDLRATRITYSPGVSIVYQNPKLDLFGQQVLATKTQKVSLSAGANQINLPTATYRSDYGYGLTYGLGFPIRNLTSASFGFDIFSKRLPSYGAQLTTLF